MSNKKDKIKIQYTQPWITELEIQYASDAAANGWGDQCYDYINRFEEAFKAHLGVKYAIATSSCTGALHMGMHALQIGAGDEVIMADTNWIATVAPIVHLGATPVFIDILPDSWCLDPRQVEDAISKKTKAIVAVHLYGNLCKMDEILAIGDRYGIPVIEDAAEAIGSVYRGKRAGSMGRFGAFSFHGTKTITTGEGGMFVTNDDDLYEQVLSLSNHGRARGQKKQFWPEIIGYKYKMSNIQAAIGLAQMERIEILVNTKQNIFKAYEKELKFLPITMNLEPVECQNGYWMPTVVVKDDISFNRENLIKLCKANDIDMRVFFWPLSSVLLYKTRFLTPQENKFSYKISERAFNLPSPYNISSEQIHFVSQLIIESIIR